MNLNKEDFYYELCVHPSSLHDIFASKIMDVTNEAIEEVGDTIIYRTSNIQKVRMLLSALEEFQEELSLINGFVIYAKSSLEKKKNLDWIKEYQRAIQPVLCGKFHIIPSWMREGARDDEEDRGEEKGEEDREEYKGEGNRWDVIIDPALAFGTGHHASTYMCIELLSQHDLASRSVLDFGCGSGILGICMAKMGAKVSLCDVDISALEVTRDNFLNNGVEFFNIGNVLKRGEQYDLIVANINEDVLLSSARELIGALSKGGYLILSGILCRRNEGIKEAFSQLSLLEEKNLDGWMSFEFVKLD